jgi:hypothetical protein
MASQMELVEAFKDGLGAFEGCEKRHLEELEEHSLQIRGTIDKLAFLERRADVNQSYVSLWVSAVANLWY